ncbi:MAG: hypothetical protein M3P40_07845 [Actinomycetota bacterium]|nr:hypothetical protein [Actinomycetota bacterium]
MDEQLDAQALVVLNAATKQVLRSNAKCRPQRAPRQRTVLSNDDPDPALTRLLSVMRRPPTAEELEAAEDFRRDHGFESGKIYRRYVRFVYIGDYRVRLSVRGPMPGPRLTRPRSTLVKTRSVLRSRRPVRMPTPPWLLVRANFKRSFGARNCASPALRTGSRNWIG